MRGLASVQQTSLDIVSIRDGVVCLGTRSTARCYRAVLSVTGPPESLADESERVQPLLDRFALFLNALSQSGVLPPAALQILVLAQPADLSGHADRLQRRALALPERTAAEALADAAWYRSRGTRLGLLDRRAYVVIPAESTPESTTVPLVGKLFGNRDALEEAGAREVLDTRCAELADRLSRVGVLARRLEDAELVRLFHTCWSRRPDVRFEQDVRHSFGGV